MGWQADLSDLMPRRRAFLSNYRNFELTRRLNGYSEAALAADPLDPAMTQVLLLSARALRLYRDGDCRFAGQLWEPTEFTDVGVQLKARDPYARFLWRRVQANVTYTTTDAGAIAKARVDAQNARKPTLLRASSGNIQASVNRTRDYPVGKREDEIFAELAGAAQGFFFRVDPLVDADGYLGDLKILYPDAGVTREEVRFEYGSNTRNNVEKYKYGLYLPRNRQIASSSDATGAGRIEQLAEDLVSQDYYGLFEDEQTFSDVDDTALLLQQAQADIRPLPSVVCEVTPALDSPLLFEDFDVGDFVRLRISHGALDVYSWVRVVEATLAVDENGNESLKDATFEMVNSGRPISGSPDDWFRQQLDDMRRRQEALERRVANIVADTTSGGASGGGGSGGGGEPGDWSGVPDEWRPYIERYTPAGGQFHSLQNNQQAQYMNSAGDLVGGGVWIGPGQYIRVKYLCPDGYNTIWIPIFSDSGGGGGGGTPPAPPSIQGFSAGGFWDLGDLPYITAAVTCTSPGSDAEVLFAIPGVVGASATCPGDGQPHFIAVKLAGLVSDTWYDVLVGVTNSSGHAEASTGVKTPNFPNLE